MCWQVLRFSARFEKPAPEDATRRFILHFHLANGFVSIYEPPQRNTGIIGGKFLSARLVQVPGSDRSNPTYYTLKHFRVGAVIEVRTSDSSHCLALSCGAGQQAPLCARGRR